MSVEDPWSPFREVMESPLEWARTWKEKTGGKIIGHVLPDVPEEIIHAAGALPVAIEGAAVQASHALGHIPTYSCNHAMGTVEMGLRGDLDMLDGMVIPYVCDTTRNLFHIWDRLIPKMHNEFLRLPKRTDHSMARDYLRAEFERLYESFAGLTGKKADAAALAESVKLYNASRAKLREAYARQQTNPGVWTGERVRLLLDSSLRTPRDEHLAWMENLPWNDQSDVAAETIRIYVRGKVWDPPGIAALLDQMGFTVVDDETVTGYRAIAQDAPLNGDPIEALVQRHMATIPYTGYHVEPRKMTGDFVDRVKASNARAVVFLNPKFCEAAAFDTPDFQKALQEASIPSLILETSARGVSTSQISLRLEAFREMIADDLP